MSEYQYYEFQAIDRQLSEKQQAQVSTLSRRVALTSTRAVFTYSHGDFHGDPMEVLEKYFDAMLYLASWGTKQLAFRFPRSIVNPNTLAPYCIADVISTSVNKGYVVLDMSFSEEGGGFWVEGEGWLSSLVPLRQDILHGDFRVLYLAWLKAISLEAYIPGEENGDHLETDEDQEDFDSDEDYEGEIESDPYQEDSESHKTLTEPLIPANLQKPSASLKSFIDLFEINEDLLAVASEASPQKGDVLRQEPEKWVAKLPDNERNDFLVRLTKGEPHLDVQLATRLRELSSQGLTVGEHPLPHRRTVSELVRAARERSERRRERKRQEAEKVKIRKFNELAKKETELWQQVFALIEKKQVKAYEEAINILRELRNLAQYFSRPAQFKARIIQVQEDYRSRPGLLSRLRDAGLVKDGI